MRDVPEHEAIAALSKVCAQRFIKTIYSFSQRRTLLQIFTLAAFCDAENASHHSMTAVAAQVTLRRQCSLGVFLWCVMKKPDCLSPLSSVLCLS